MTQPNNQSSVNNMDVFSVYIPSINKNNTVDKIKRKFLELSVGQVYRVDFAAIKGKEESKFQSAFVYFTKLLFTPSYIIDEIEKFGAHRLDLYKNYFVSRDHEGEYWLLLKNKIPFKETTLNVHQISHNATLLEEKVTGMDTKMAQMDTKMAQMDEKMARMAQMDEKMAQMEEKMTQMEVKLIKLEEENTKLKEDAENVQLIIDNNILPYLHDINAESYETQDKIGRLQRISYKQIECLFNDPDKTIMYNDLMFGIQYSKRFLKNEYDYGDSDNEQFAENCNSEINDNKEILLTEGNMLLKKSDC